MVTVAAPVDSTNKPVESIADAATRFTVPVLNAADDVNEYVPSALSVNPVAVPKPTVKSD